MTLEKRPRGRPRKFDDATLVRLIEEGKNRDEIAAALGCRPFTVVVHAQRLRPGHFNMADLPEVVDPLWRRPSSIIVGGRWRANQSAMFALLSQSECTDCGLRDVCTLEFDHVGEKSAGISYMMRTSRWDKILEEMKQCEIVCANCHRRRTAARAGTYRATMSGLTVADLVVTE